MMQSYSRNRRNLWPLIVAGAVILALVAVLGVFVGTLLGGDKEAATPSASPTAKPTWDVTAQPVPNEYGSYGQFEPGEVARRYVIEVNTWSPDEPLPEGWLSRARPWVTDSMFKSMLEDGMVAPGVDENVVGRKINVTDVSNASGGLETLDVAFEATDILKDGTERKVEGTQYEAVELAKQDVQVKEGNGTRTIQEWRVDSSWPGEKWGEGQ